MSNVFLRPVNWSDVDFLYEWANDKLVRNNSFSTAIIPYDEHKRWFENCMADRNTIMYMLCNNELKIGQIRLNCEEDTAKVNYSVSKEYRGLGYGKIMIHYMEKKILLDRPDIKFIIAFVKSENEASKKVFEESGYTGTYDNNKQQYFYLKKLTR
ncbi:GNAT family N-acetyltransferase [Desulfitobacterium sp. Sab5]|uniref:GNAT family N-acetyltransferase n=1 Tax=Desulfitobacterium nosdiversum TaxID=3375356 RepID=UPI003CFBBFC5